MKELKLYVDEFVIIIIAVMLCKQQFMMFDGFLVSVLFVFLNILLILDGIQIYLQYKILQLQGVLK